jgi:N-acetylglucosaminyldiphosphoundecaprenol N-acetyl-beta-D-mannosaminyltransferase
MRILHVCTQMEAGGAQRVAWSLTEDARNQGQDAQLLFLYRKRPAFPDLPHVRCLFSRRPDPAEFACLLRLIWQSIREFRPDALYTHTHYANALVQPIAAVLCVPQRIAVHHSLLTSHPRAARWLDKINGTLGIYSRIVMVSRGIRDSAASYPYRYRRRIKVIHNGVEPPPAGLPDCPAAPDRRYHILSVGRLSPAKNQALLLEVIRHMPDVGLVIAGEGELREELEAQVQRLDLHPQVRLTGEVERPVVWSLLAQADVFVLPSRYEGIPLALIEAMAARKPVIATDIPASREVLTMSDGALAGILVPQDDAGALARELRALLSDPKRRRELADRAQARSDDFSHDRMLRAYRAFWDRDARSEESGPDPIPSVRILRTKVSLLDGRGLLDAIATFVDERQPAVVASGNVHAYNIACSQPWFREFLNRAELVRLDGAGVSLAARLLGYAPPARSTWADFGWSLAEHAAARGDRLFLFGGKPGVAEAAARRLRECNPSLCVVGIQHGYLDFKKDSKENRDLIEALNVSSADILIVGLGMPLQERWISENRHRINIPVIMTGGGVFDFLSGRVRRAPRWMLDHGMEWLFRLCIEPYRMWRRYLIGNPLFVLRVLGQRLAEGKAQPDKP